jgi:hypothetical protein
MLTNPIAPVVVLAAFLLYTFITEFKVSEWSGTYLVKANKTSLLEKQ